MTKVKDARLNAGLTQQQVSDLIGIPKRTLENYEQGSRNPAPWIENLLVDKIRSLGGMDMLADKIKKALEKEIMKNNVMGSEVATATLLLTAGEKQEFLNKVWRQFDSKHHTWDFEGTELTIHWCEDGFWTKKYNIYEWEEEIKDFEDIFEGCAILTDGSEPVLLKSFDTLEEAKEFLATQETTISKMYTNTGHVWMVKEAWIDSEWEDEDGVIVDREDTEDVTSMTKALKEAKERYF